MPCAAFYPNRELKTRFSPTLRVGFLEKGQFENSRESRILEAFLETLENSREFLRNSSPVCLIA